MTSKFIARSWLDLHERLFSFHSDTAINRYRNGFVFRGLSDASHREMRTSLMRIGGDYPKKEKHIIRNFRKYAHLSVSAGSSDWHWISVGQHHGLPTRLLDWTYSPYIALHFATCDLAKMNQDALIWCVDIDETNKFLPCNFSSVLENQRAHVFTASMLEEVSPDLTHIAQTSGEFPVWLEPPSLDDRIVNQFALFSMMSKPEAIMSEWLDAHSNSALEIIIPSTLKWDIRDRLDQANITERVVYPGLQGLSAWLRRHYFTRQI